MARSTSGQKTRPDAVHNQKWSCFLPTSCRGACFSFTSFPQRVLPCKKGRVPLDLKLLQPKSSTNLLFLARIKTRLVETCQWNRLAHCNVSATFSRAHCVIARTFASVTGCQICRVFCGTAPQLCVSQRPCLASF